MSVFISYSRADYDDFVSLFVDDLQANGVSIWIDQYDLRLGTPDWEQAIRDAIRNAEAVLLIATVNSRKSPYVRDELAIAYMENKPIMPIWAKGENGRYPDCIPIGYSFRQNIDARGPRRYRDAIGNIVSALSGKIAVPVLSTTEESLLVDATAGSINPYRGLQAFHEQHRRFFFGRESLTDTLVEGIQSVAKSSSRLLAVVGASGSGKSSVIMAGMIPRLRNATNWLILDPMIPGTRPLENLAVVLSKQLPRRSLMAISDDLQHRSAHGLNLLTKTILEDKSPNDHLGIKSFSPTLVENQMKIFLYIDQFEELFTNLVPEPERQQFINLLVASATESDYPLVIILSLRADFYDRPMNYPELGAIINQNNQSVLPMTLSELFDAIERPARLPDVNLQFEPGLVSEIVFALREKQDALAGALPLLQFALERLYQARTNHVVTRAAYEDIGKIEGAIGTYAEAVFNELDKEAQNALGFVFMTLVTLDERGTPTRNRAFLADLTQDNAAAERLVEALVKARLLVITSSSIEDIPYVEVAHEALLSRWSHLVTWIETVAGDLRLRDQVFSAAQQWYQAGRPDYMLWPYERQNPVYVMLKRRNFGLDEVTYAFLKPEWERLLEEFEKPDTKDHRKLTIIDRWVKMGEQAVPALAQALSFVDSFEQPTQFEALTQALHPFYKAAIPDLISVLNNPKREIRRNVLKAIKNVEKRPIVMLTNALRSSPLATVRQNAAGALGKLEIIHALPELVNALHDNDTNVISSAAKSLGELGDPRATFALIEAFHISDITVKQVVAESLGKIGDLHAVTVLIDALNHSDPTVRLAVVDALQELDDIQAVPALIGTLQDVDSEVRANTAQALGKLGDQRAVPALVQAFTDQEAYVRRNIAEALGNLGDINTVPVLITALRSFEIEVRQEAVTALGKLGDPSSVSVLQSTLKDPSLTVRFAAATALYAINTEEAINALDDWRNKNLQEYNWWQETIKH